MRLSNLLRLSAIPIILMLLIVPLTVHAQEGGTVPPNYVIVLIIILMAVIILMTIVSFIYLQRKLLAKCTDVKCLEEYFTLPFGVPVGTVRSVITFIIIAIGLMMFALQVFYGGIIKIPETLANVIMAVIAFYFGTRAGSRREIRPRERPVEEPVTPEEKSQISEMIGKAKNVVETLDEAKNLLPGKEKEKVDDILNTARNYLDEAQKAEKEGKYSTAKTAANLIENLVKKQDPVKNLLQDSVGTIGTIIGANPATALVGNMIRVGSTLAGNYFEKWKKRVLEQPIAIADVNPNILDADTAEAVFISIDLFKRSFQKELMSNKPEDKNRLLNTLKAFATDESVDNLWKKHEKKIKGSREEFIQSIQLLKEMLVDVDLNQALQDVDFGILNNYQNFASLLEKVKDDKEGPSILSRLIDLVHNVREKKLSVEKLLRYLKD